MTDWRKTDWAAFDELVARLYDKREAREREARQLAQQTDFGWLLRASREGQARDQASAGYQAFRRMGVVAVIDPGGTR